LRKKGPSRDKKFQRKSQRAFSLRNKPSEGLVSIAKKKKKKLGEKDKKQKKKEKGKINLQFWLPLEDIRE
jgi:hypothetical protein